MLTAARYRKAQAVVMAVLAALVTACVVFAPLYNRALQQAMVTSALRAAPAQVTGLSLTSYSAVDRAAVRSPDQLAALVPPDLATSYAAPVRSQQVAVRELPLTNRPDGSLVWRDGQCAHVRLDAGRCPSQAGEVAVTAAQLAARPSWTVGSTLDVGEYDDAVSTVAEAPRLTVTVVGVYTQPDDPFWFGEELAGRTESGGLDAMLTDRATFSAVGGAAGAPSSPWRELHNGADLALTVGGTGIDEVVPLGARVDTFRQVPWAATAANAQQLDDSVPVYAATGLPEIARELASGRDQADVTVALLMVQLALLLGCVLWLVMVAATDQRRAEVAVARLRGRGSAGARQLLLGETLPPVLLGVPVGVGAAFGLSWLARHLTLPGTPPFEVPGRVVPTIAVAAAAMTGLALVSVRRVSREPVASLLRSVGSRPSGFTLGVLEAMLVAGAAACFLALATGSVSGPVGLAAPTLLAVAVGVVGGRLVPLAMGAGGRWLLHRGRLASGSGVLQAGRRGTTRWLLPVVTVAVCLVVFAANALAVAGRNREGRAEAEVGAPTVLTLASTDARLVADAVEAFDPAGRHATAVAVMTPPNDSSATTFAVRPEQFRRIALWPDVRVASLPWASLTGPGAKPLVVTGTSLSYHLLSGGLTADTEGLVAEDGRTPPPAQVSLGLQVVRADGATSVLPIGDLPAVPTSHRVRAPIDCASGCPVLGIAIVAPPASVATLGTFTLTDLAVGGSRVDIGTVASWRSFSDTLGAARAEDAPGGLQVDFTNGGQTQVVLPSAAVPDQVTGLGTGPVVQSAGQVPASATMVDGSSLPLTVSGAVPFVPGGPRSAYLVNLDNMLVRGWQGRGSAVMKVYADTTDTAYLTSLQKALQGKGIGVVEMHHPAELVSGYEATAASWSLRLAIVVGGTALGVAALAIVVLMATSWRARSRDYAGLRMAGVSGRAVAATSLVESVPVILVSGLLGAACGLFAARAAMPMVPLFPAPPPTFAVDLRIAWVAALAAAVVGALLLVAVGLLASRWVVRRSTFERLRETA